MNAPIFELTPLAWTDFYFGDDQYSIRSKKDFLQHLQKYGDAKDYIYNIDTSNIKSLPERIQSLLVGYTLLDIGDWFKALTFMRYKMWRLFEDMVYEIFREVLKNREECKILRVDSLHGFRGLDFIIMNDEKEDWNVGIQCKRYIRTKISDRSYSRYGKYSQNVSTIKLINLSHNLRSKHQTKRFVLTAFDVYYHNKHQKNRYQKLVDEGLWDKIIIFNKPKFEYDKYSLNCQGLNMILNWC